jgi:hypothetical protein
MKNFIFLSLLLLVASSCSLVSLPEKVKQEISGEKVLRKMTSVTDQKTSGASAFFLFAGSSSFSSTSEVNVIFAWKMTSGEYQTTSVPITKIRTVFDSLAVAPTVSFHFLNAFYTMSDACTFNDQTQLFFNEHLAYIKIRVKPEDWPLDIQLPLNEKKFVPKDSVAVIK